MSAQAHISIPASSDDEHHIPNTAPKDFFTSGRSQMKQHLKPEYIGRELRNDGGEPGEMAVVVCAPSTTELIKVLERSDHRLPKDGESWRVCVEGETAYSMSEGQESSGSLRPSKWSRMK